MATINSLGLGSGVLTSDVIDKLRGNDESLLIKPIDNKITLHGQKSQALDLLNSLLSSFRSSAGALDNDTLYQKRTVSGNNDSVSVTAASGTQLRDFSLNVTNIAKKSVVQSASYATSSDLVANGAGTLKIAIGGKELSVSYSASTTLDGLKQAINDAAGSDVTASILQTGTSAYSLVIGSKNTGKDQAITLTDISGQLKDTKILTSNAHTGSFVAKDAFIASGGTSGNVSVNVGATTVDFAYTDTTTLKGLVDNINANTTLNAKVTASIVQYGTNDFRMILTPKSASIGDSITISDSSTGLSPALTGLVASAGSAGIVQDAQDAHFTFDGIAMTRSSNNISDISNGLSVTLLKDGGTANISITQNRDQIATEIDTFSKSYNTLIKQLDDMTAYDVANGKVGIFNGDNTIKTISREITKIVTSTSLSGHSLPQYGIGLNRDGSMSFDKSIFLSKMNETPDETEAFLSGKTTIGSTGVASTASGVFTTLTDLLNKYTSDTGLMGNLNKSSKTELTSLNAEKTKATKLLEARYATMQARFIAYDSLISKLNSQFSALKQQIDAQNNAKN